MTVNPPSESPSQRPGETDNADPVLSRLRSANPEPLDQSNPSSWDGADSLFAQITSRPAGFEPYGDPEPEVVTTSSGRSRWPMLAAVAAAVALIAGAVAVLLPSSGQPALATVSAAADQTAVADTGRIITTFSADGQEGADSESLSGTLTAAFSGDDVSVSVSADEASSVLTADQADQLSTVETRVVDGQVYLTADGVDWMSLEAPEMFESALVEFTDLRTVLAEVNDLIEVTEVGATTIDGVEVTHYRSEVDLADESLAESGWLPGMDGPQAGAVDIEAEGLVTIDLYVADDGLMRRIQASGEAEPADPTVDASADFSVTTDFVDLGSDITIEAPDPDMVMPLEGFGFDGREPANGDSDE